MWNFLPCSPTRSCRKKTGPFEVSFTSAATTRRKGKSTQSAAAEATMSSSRFTTRSSGFTVPVV